MSCYHPLKGLVFGVNPEGKKIIKIIKSQNLDYINKNDYIDIIEVPCGHCIGCRLDYSREWANRCVLESQYHDRACFITLTYNDEHLPPCNEIYDSDGVCATSPVHPLDKSALQRFWKRLRKAFPNTSIRYFACGEYGSNTYRPHYHAIVYGIDFHEDRKLIKSVDGCNYYTSPTLSKLWSEENEELGYHIITDVSWNTCAYVARYITKKSYGRDAKRYEDFGIPCEFAVMSRRPGIGFAYYNDHKREIYENDELFITMSQGGKRIQPPKYFDRLYELEVPDAMQVIKDSRSHRVEVRNTILSDISELEYLDYLSVKEDNHSEKVKSLKRDL